MGQEEDGGLRRHLGFVTLTLYGVGVIVGAGIFVLVGKVVGEAGNATWLAFVGAAVAALPTGLSYASLASRYPRSAGEAVFLDRAGGPPWAAFVVGYLVVASGVASTAAVSHGFASYLAVFVPLPSGWRELAMVLFLLALSAVNLRGIREATWINILCTVTSVSALLVVVVASLPSWGTVDWLDASAGAPAGASPGGATAVLAAIALSFYAFIGFEDVCNVAEEVREPERTIPRAIVVAMAVVAVIYLVVGLSVVSAVPARELAEAGAPLALVAERVLPGLPPQWLSAVALFAVTNTALFNLIMASRILYGMGRQGWIPPVFGAVHPRLRTPTWGVALAFVLAAAFALTGVLQILAEATNTIILVVFFVVNASLLVVELRKIPPARPERGFFRVPLAVPIAGMGVTGYLVAQFSAGAYARAAGLVGFGAVLFVAGKLLARGRSASS